MDYVTIPNLTELADGSIVGTDELIIYDTSATETKSTKLSSLLTYMSANISSSSSGSSSSSSSDSSSSSSSTEFIIHTSTGAINPTKSIVLVIAQADLTLPSITDTPKIIAILASGASHNVTCASSNYIYLVNSIPTSHTLADKELLVLFSSDTTQNVWVPISTLANISAI